jgi:biopolymer transport protein ExbD
MKVRCSTTSISALLFSLCLILSVPAALSSASTWNELTIKLPYGAMWNFLAPLGFADLGIVAIGLIVLWTGFRKRERWAWFVMLIALLFYFPYYVLPVVLQVRHFGWPYLLYLLGAFRGGWWYWVEGWWYCWIESLHPDSAVGIADYPAVVLIRPLEFLVMLVALLLPVKGFFWRPELPQPEARTEIATQTRTKKWAWALALLLVFAIAVAVTVGRIRALSQSEMAELQQFYAVTFRPYPMVSVDLAKAEHLVSMPGAGSDDAIVVAVTRDGAVFLRNDKVDPARLGSRIRANRTDRTGQTMYLRADRRAQYRNVENAVEAMHNAGAEVVGLLTKRKEDAQTEGFLWIGNPLFESVGLEVSFPSLPKIPSRGSSPPDPTIVVHVVWRPGDAPAYKINAADVGLGDLQSRLNEIFANRAERVMFIKGDEDLNFSDIVDVIDIGRASGVDHIVLLSPN